MKLMEQVSQILRVRHYSLATERCYCQWIRRFIFFHGVKHPNTMGAEEVERFLTHLATAEKVAASTQNQALNALVFLYREVLRMDLGNFDAVRARRPLRVPTVLSQVEAKQLLDAVGQLKTTEPYHLMCQLMYGSGLRLMECCRLRVKDIDLQRGQMTVRGGKGDKDRYVMLPAAAQEGVRQQMAWRTTLQAHEGGDRHRVGWAVSTGACAGVALLFQDVGGVSMGDRDGGRRDRGTLADDDAEDAIAAVAAQAAGAWPQAARSAF